MNSHTSSTSFNVSPGHLNYSQQNDQIPQLSFAPMSSYHGDQTLITEPVDCPLIEQIPQIPQNSVTFGGE